jgi:hypothetical protein
LGHKDGNSRRVDVGQIDRKEKLFSLPATFGVAESLWISRACHLIVILLLLAFGLGIGGGFLRLTFQAQRWLKGMLYQQSGISQADHGIMELAAAYGAAQMASRTFAPQMALAQAALTGTGKASRGYQAAEAEIGTRRAETEASADFAPRRHQAQWQGETAALGNAGSRAAYQARQVMTHAALSDPAVQAAKATESATGKQAKPVWSASLEEREVGAGQAAQVYGGMYGFEGLNNPYTRKQPPMRPNPYTGHTVEQMQALWRLPALPGKTTYGVPVEPASEQSTQGE